MPDHVSYVSVFGLSTIREVQDRINGCLEQSQSAFGSTVAHLGSKVIRSLSALASNAKVPVPYMPMQLPDFSNLLFWQVAKNCRLLIVFDDLERANPALQLDQLLGLASSIAENSAAKILLVFNEDELPGEGPKIFTRFREKVVDGEFTFRPSIAELVAEYLGEDSLKAATISCLEVKGGPNIRLIQRIRRGIRFFRETATKLNIPVEDATLVQMAKIIWHFHVSPVPLKDEVTLVMSIWGHMGGRNEDESSEGDKEAIRLAREVGLHTTPFDKLMLEYLNHGYLSEDFLREFADEQNARHHAEKLESEVDAVIHLYDKNFLSSEATIAAAVEQLLERRFLELSLSQMKMLTGFLDAFGRPSASWWRQHVNAVAPTRTTDGCKAYLSVLTDPEARQVIQSRLDTLVEPFDPMAVILKIGEHQGWGRDDLHKLNAVDAEVYKTWLRTADGDLFSPLRGFLEQFANAPEGTPELQIHSKLVGVLTELAGESPANRLRVKYIFGLPIE